MEHYIYLYGIILLLHSRQFKFYQLKDVENSLELNFLPEDVLKQTKPTWILNIRIWSDPYDFNKVHALFLVFLYVHAKHFTWDNSPRGHTFKRNIEPFI